MIPSARSAPVRMVAPPGCMAQSNSVGSAGETGVDDRRVWNAGRRADCVREGTRGERMTFQPCGWASKPRSGSVEGRVWWCQVRRW